MKKFFFLLFLLPLFSFSQNGMITKHYLSGRVLSQIHYVDGVQDGLCRYYHDYGSWVIMSEVNYKNGKMTGLLKTYFKTGQLEHEGNYKYTDKGVYSKKDGVWKTYYKNGQLRMESIIKDGIQVEWKSYDTDGELQAVPEDGC